MLGDLLLVKALPYIEQAHSRFSFTGKVFYELKIIHPEESDGWLTVSFTPVERFGAYNVDQATQARYCEEFGKTAQDPTCGPALYPRYNLLIDTGIVVVRGLVRYIEQVRRDPLSPHVLAIGRICDASDTATP